MKIKNNKGFSLIELLVVCTVFSIIIVALSGVFVSVIRAQKYSLVAQQMLDQTSYAMEYLSRDLRMAKKQLVSDGTLVCSGFGTNYLSEGENYRISGTMLPGVYNQILSYKNYDKTKCFLVYWTKVDNPPKGYLHIRTNGGSSVDLTQQDATGEQHFLVQNFNVDLIGASQNDSLQPKITIFMEMIGQRSVYKPKIKIQTTISQRDLDILE
jgi:prepilin-type N-terminal cleavage/methylation domain-containing protein